VTSDLLCYVYLKRKHSPSRDQIKKKHTASIKTATPPKQEKIPDKRIFNILNAIKYATTCDAVSLIVIDHYSSKILRTYICDTAVHVEKNIENRKEMEMLKNSDIIQALHNGSPILHENNKRAIIPIVYNNMLFGSMYIRKNETISGKDLQLLQEYIPDLAHELA
jgi:hypothetical protein